MTCSIVSDEGIDRDLVQVGDTTEKDEFDEDREADDFGAQVSQQPDGGAGGPAGGDNIINEENALSLEHRVGVDLEGIDAVFELVFLPYRLKREFSRLAQRNEPRLDSIGDGCGKCEPPGFDPGHLGDPIVRIGRRHPGDQLVEGPRIGEDGGYVFEDDPFLGEVGYVSDQCFEVVHTQSLRPDHRLPDFDRRSTHSARSIQAGSFSFQVANSGAAMKIDE